MAEKILVRTVRRNGNRVTVEFDKGNLGDESLGVADRVSSVRPGAKFQPGFRRDGSLARCDGLQEYDAEFAKGLAHGEPTPDVDINPYNFAEWEGGASWKAEEDERTGTRQDREQDQRKSGVIEVQYRCETPVCVAAGPRTEDSREPFHLFRCRDADGEQLPCLPGSSLKGAVRVLFETLTNSRLGVAALRSKGAEDYAIDWPLLYRRRAAQLFIVTKMPQDEKDGEVEVCRFEFRPQNARNLPESVQLRSTDRPTTVKEWRANLLWVTSDHYDHGNKTQLAYHQTGTKLLLPWKAFEKWEKMAGHPHFKSWYEINVGNLPGPMKRVHKSKVPSYSAWRNDLFTLNVKDLIFGICDGNKLSCFGKSVNFLWPSGSPAALAGDFLERSTTPGSGAPAGSQSPAEQSPVPADADASELVFGLVAGKAGLRGRVRFTPFWLDPKESGKAATPQHVGILQLAAPRARGKSRVLYHKQDGTGAPDPGVEPGWRGRKFYWHQRPHPQYESKGLPRQHTTDALLRDGPTPPKENPALDLEVLAPGAILNGEVHFSNLTDAELGALLASLSPDLLFQRKNPKLPFGIKLGKGKPRGLGTLRARRVVVKTLRPAKERYCALKAEDSLQAVVQHAHQGDDVTLSSTPACTKENDLVGAFETWIEKKAEKKIDRCAFYQDLAKLLAIPEEPSVRLYPPNFRQYAWSSGWCNLTGGPSDEAPARRSTKSKPNKPKAMKRARDL